jgi:hypothetical protein
MGYLLDNPLTQGWSQAVDRLVVGPVERAFLNDEDLRQQVSKLVRERTPDSNVLSEQQLKAFEILKGAPGNSSVLQEKMQSEVDPRKYIGDQVFGAIEKYKPSRARQGEVAALLADGRVGLTKGGDYMRQFGLGSPAAAYGAVAGGGALAAYGVHELLQAQQRAEKEAQLPLEQ